MERRLRSKILAVLIAPLVLGLGGAGVWLGAQGAQESLRVAKASDQIISVVLNARKMGVRPDGDVPRLLRELLDNLASFRDLSGSYGQGPSGPFINIQTPWGNWMKLFLYPQSMALRLEEPLGRVACRKILQFFSRDAEAFGLLRIDAKEESPMAPWKLVYLGARAGGAAGQQGRAMDASAVLAGCGTSSSAVVSLTFSLIKEEKKEN